MAKASAAEEQRSRMAKEFREVFHGIRAWTSAGIHLYRSILKEAQLDLIRTMGWRDCRFAHSLAFRSRRALLITETELRLIAAPARIGLRSRPKNG